MLAEAEALAGFIHFLFLELALFAALGFLIAGIDEFVIDVVWIVRTLWRRVAVYTRYERSFASALPALDGTKHFAVFIPVWDESRVIAPMLRHALDAYQGADVTLFVGCYANDAATIEAVRGVADKRIEIVVGPAPGKTTKADNLNTMWQALDRHGGERFAAVILHDAEDVISDYEIRVIAHLLPRFGLIQLPVAPLVDHRSLWVSGHYCDEFAESHGKGLVVREALGTSLPLAGVGCAIRMDVLSALSDRQEGRPFDDQSLTEDYETGVRLSASGVPAAFVRMREFAGGPIVATKAHFPADAEKAIRQKSRWIIGIAIAGWDRIGWSRSLTENWMRLRDRQGLFAGLVLFAGYLALILGAVSWLMALMLSLRFDVPETILTLSLIVTVSLVWRLAVRAYFVGRVYGLAEALRSVPRAVIANYIAIMAARRAAIRYFEMARAGQVEWDKTTHTFPEHAR